MAAPAEERRTRPRRSESDDDPSADRIPEQEAADPTVHETYSAYPALRPRYENTHFDLELIVMHGGHCTPEDKCAICLEEFGAPSPLRKVLQCCPACKQVFHADCVKTLNTCPLCRSEEICEAGTLVRYFARQGFKPKTGDSIYLRPQVPKDLIFFRLNRALRKLLSVAMSNRIDYYGMKPKHLHQQRWYNFEEAAAVVCDLVRFTVPDRDYDELLPELTDFYIHATDESRGGDDDEYDDTPTPDFTLHAFIGSYPVCLRDIIEKAHSLTKLLYDLLKGDAAYSYIFLRGSELKKLVDSFFGPLIW